MLRVDRTFGSLSDGMTILGPTQSRLAEVKASIASFWFLLPSPFVHDIRSSGVVTLACSLSTESRMPKFPVNVFV